MKLTIIQHFLAQIHCTIVAFSTMCNDFLVPHFSNDVVHWQTNLKPRNIQKEHVKINQKVISPFSIHYTTVWCIKIKGIRARIKRDHCSFHWIFWWIKTKYSWSFLLLSHFEKRRGQDVSFFFNLWYITTKCRADIWCLARTTDTPM